MNVAVFDTYVIRKDGETMHFDILVSKGTPQAKVLEYGKEYLASKNQKGQALGVEECKFCHIEQASPDIEESIRDQGFHIIEMDGCD